MPSRSAYGALTALVVLDVSYNNFSGSLAPLLVARRRLDRRRLQQSAGVTPAALSLLTSLSVGGNALLSGTIPPGISSFPSLRYLDISNLIGISGNFCVLFV